MNCDLLQISDAVNLNSHFKMISLMLCTTVFDNLTSTTTKLGRLAALTTVRIDVFLVICSIYDRLDNIRWTDAVIPQPYQDGGSFPTSFC